MSSCGSNAGMGTSAPLINAIVNNALFHSINSHINQSLPQINVKNLSVHMCNALTCTSEVVFKLGDTSCFNQHPWIMHLDLNTIFYT